MVMSPALNSCASAGAALESEGEGESRKAFHVCLLEKADASRCDGATRGMGYGQGATVKLKLPWV